MNTGRVKRGAGPKSKLTKSTYRKKALPYLLEDFSGQCAYCLDPDDFRHPSQSHVDHFDCKVRGRQRHRYRNLMLGCAACNMTKHDKPVINPFDLQQRMLNCTEENEFPKHITETEDGDWHSVTAAGDYHLACIGLKEHCHKSKRAERAKMARRVHSLLTQAVQYESRNPVEVHSQIMGTIHDILSGLDKFPPLVTTQGVISVRCWLVAQGIDPTILNPITPAANEDAG
jgi:hypothetical protein